MVADQHRLAHLVGRRDAARRVGQRDDPAAGRDRGPHAVHDHARGMALVQVHPADQHQQPPPRRHQGQGQAGVTGHGRRREAAQVGHRDPGDSGIQPAGQRVGGRGPAGPQDHGHVVPRLAGPLGEPGGTRRRGSERVAGQVAGSYLRAGHARTYGLPSAAGALTLPTRPATAMIVAT